ncbi:LLM class F420-dependent oxidoreductase [Longimycelium tulufanense]|uniref:LLM class F420-dependent oxidoreductase n=1 Tax=Longimycelium tulufanense TaxID=907463 RepID=A0A8J3FXE1_9PSEU|nr:LLM class F420-dependent oxidoreductase [Longimycelium tulufanense]GGM73562.1 LLM class F420-dependent oxidoreductase [Longimycelium tulufanense]
MSFVTDESIAPGVLGREVESRGFESLFVPEHTHIPLARTTGPGGTPLSREYFRTVDPFVTLAAAAATTSRLRLATGIALVPQRDPITLAKQVASLDHVSGGRFELGIGAGWNEPEIANHGTDPRRRFAVMRERVLAMKQIWGNEVAEFHGEHVDFGPIYSWPKPVQRPNPPILLGGWAKTTFSRLLDYADGWMAPPSDIALIAEGIRELRALAAEQNRPEPPVTVTLNRADRAEAERAIELGVRRVVFLLDSKGHDETLRRLDELTPLIA